MSIDFIPPRGLVGIQNVGGEKELVKEVVGGVAMIRTLKEGTDINLTQNTDDVEIESTGGGGGGGTRDNPVDDTDGTAVLEYIPSTTTVSLPSGAAWLNQGTSTFSETPRHAALSIDPDGTANFRGIEWAISATTKFRAKILLAVASGSCNFGLFVRNSSTGHILNMGRQASNTNIEVQNWNAVTTFNNGSGYGIVYMPVYFELENTTGNTWASRTSVDGENWITHETVSYATLFGGGAPDKFGVGGYANTSGSAPANIGTIEWVRAY